LCVYVAGCGYTTKSSLPPRHKTIHVEKFANKIDFTAANQRNLYFPLLEVDVKNAVIDRFLFDGNLRIADADLANLILKGDLVGYHRSPLRYTDDDDVLEYRIQISVNLKMIEVGAEEPFWTENGFVGEAEYFVSGALAKTESVVVKEAIKDLARRIVERTIENW